MDNSRTGINSLLVASLFPLGNNVQQMNLNAKLNIVLAMQVFARVVEAGTFTKAADSLKMPKATVTKLVQGLENHLRVRLLNRTTRRVTVTPDGSAYYERAVRLLGDLEDIESSVSNAQAWSSHPSLMASATTTASPRTAVPSSRHGSPLRSRPRVHRATS